MRPDERSRAGTEAAKLNSRGTCLDARPWASHSEGPTATLLALIAMRGKDHELVKAAVDISGWRSPSAVASQLAPPSGRFAGFPPPVAFPSSSCYYRDAVNDRSRDDAADNHLTIPEDHIVRAVAALLPFVRRWKLSLNPEDLYEMAGAVITHYRSAAPDTPEGWEEIDRVVNAQIDEFEQRGRGMHS